MENKLDNFLLVIFIVTMAAYMIYLYSGFTIISGIGIIGLLMFANSLRSAKGRKFRRKRYGHSNLFVMFYVLLKEKFKKTI